MKNETTVDNGSYAELNKAGAEEVLKWAFERFHPNIALASSFGAEDMVVLDMIRKLNPEARVFSLDTQRLHTETYDLLHRAEQKYNLKVERMTPQADAVEEMVREHGLNLFYDSVDKRKMCCGVRKVKPLKRILSTLQAWITGLRRDQAATRADVHKVGVDEGFGGIIKVNPIADWSSDQVWDYIRVHDVPYNLLHDRGFPSIGCEPCTRPVKPGEDPRAGRWWWELGAGQKECGLHATVPSNETTKM
ncbi:MAG: phosphoadenylyl-sulfate reductase [Acidobacteriota bacterium]